MDMLLERNCNREEFFLLYFKFLQERIPDSTLQVLDSSAIHITNSAGKESTTYIDNLWKLYSDGEEDRRELLERYLRTVTSSNEEDRPLQRTAIVAIVKDIQYMQIFSPNNVAKSEHLCGDLWVVYAEDLPESTKSLHANRIDAAGIPDDLLRDIAKENLHRIMPDIERHGDGPWYLLTAGGDYTASLLIFDDLWLDLADSVEGDIVAVAPSRDVVMYTGHESGEAIAEIRKRAENIIASGDHIVSSTLLHRVGGRWEVYKPQ